MDRLTLWIGFHILVLGLLALDLGVFHRRAHRISLREAGLWSALWIALSLAFNAGIYWWMGRQAALEFLAGYLIEKALSVDNLFVFSVIFGLMGVPSQNQHRVLFWGIVGALVMRGAFILTGSALVHRFEWVLYLFAAFLVYTGIKMARHRTLEVHPEQNPILRFARKRLPLTPGYVGSRFFVRVDGKTLATPMLLTLLTIETTDVVFAVDSIPAIFAVTRDPFLIYTSNIFAILGLRALYFVLADLVDRFKYLKVALSVILVFIGAKMALHRVYEVPISISLAFITITLIVATLGPWLVGRLQRARR